MDKTICKHVVVVGAGTAGWLAALRLQKVYPDNKITVIKNDRIGILGAGEGSTPHLVGALSGIGISIFDLIKNTNSTIKTGIKFVNWRGEQDSYFHGFSITEKKQIRSFLPQICKESDSVDDFYLPYLVAKSNKSPWANIPVDTAVSKDYTDSNDFFKDKENGVGFSVHFNAVELATYLEKIAVERDIAVVSDLVEDIDKDEHGYITALQLKDNGELPCDFVIDCTGFHRFVIGKLYKSEWVSLKDHLPMDSAQPFFLPPSNPIHPWTEAIAQDCGWIWKIPLQNRFGCGYVYDSNYITNDEVKTKILEIYPDAELGKKTFSFEAGYYKECVVKNCYAVGLSSGFVEPLEATSIFSFILSMDHFIDYNYLGRVFNRELTQESEGFINATADRINILAAGINLNICNFVQFHYMTDRKDTPFWKEFRSRNKIFNVVYGEMANVRHGDFQEDTFTWAQTFGRESWTVVGAGCGMLDKDNIHVDTNIDLDVFKQTLNEYVDTFVDHGEVIEYGRLNGK